MQQAQAKTKQQRVSPQKARYAAGLIKRFSLVDEAIAQLEQSPLKAARMLVKTLKSACANAENNLNINRRSLKVVEVRVDEGPRLKRTKARNKGGRSPIVKRTSHFTIVVGN